MEWPFQNILSLSHISLSHKFYLFLQWYSLLCSLLIGILWNIFSPYIQFQNMNMLLSELSTLHTLCSLTTVSLYLFMTTTFFIRKFYPCTGKLIMVIKHFILQYCSIYLCLIFLTVLLTLSASFIFIELLYVSSQLLYFFLVDKMVLWLLLFIYIVIKL